MPIDNLAELREHADRAAHECARKLPFLADEELAELIDDMREHGQREPILMTGDGRIVDGRNRYIACRVLGREPRIDKVEDGANIAALVLSLNIHRRHLATSQRAAIAAELANLKRGGAQPANSPDAVSQAEAAALMQVSERSVRTAARIKSEDPQLHEQVKNGTLSTHAAEQLLEMQPAERTKAIGTIAAAPTRRARRSALRSARSRAASPRRGGLSLPAVYGRYAKLLHVIAVLSDLAAELEAMPAILREQPLAPGQASQLKAAVGSLLTLDFAAVAAAARAAIAAIDSHATSSEVADAPQ